jgi:hypothetical protein
VINPMRQTIPRRSDPILANATCLLALYQANATCHPTPHRGDMPCLTRSLPIRQAAPIRPAATCRAEPGQHQRDVPRPSSPLRQSRATSLPTPRLTDATSRASDEPTRKSEPNPSRCDEPHHSDSTRQAQPNLTSTNATGLATPNPPTPKEQNNEIRLQPT